MGFAADQERSDTSPAVRGHHDEVAAFLYSRLDDGLVRRIVPLVNDVTGKSRFLGLFFNRRQVRFRQFLGSAEDTGSIDDLPVRVEGVVVQGIGIAEQLTGAGRFAFLNATVA